MNPILIAILGAALRTIGASAPPAFGEYPATEPLHGPMVMPHIVDAEERRFRTELRRAVTKGYDVVDGSTEHERRGPNFAGHYLLVQWGCGSNCMQAALIDANSGHVLRLPQVPGSDADGFSIPTGSVDFRTLQFRTGSRLLVLPNIADGHSYYYVLEQERWRFLKKLPTRQP